MEERNEERRRGRVVRVEAGREKEGGGGGGGGGGEGRE